PLCSTPSPYTTLFRSAPPSPPVCVCVCLPLPATGRHPLPEFHHCPRRTLRLTCPSRTETEAEGHMHPPFFVIGFQRSGTTLLRIDRKSTRLNSSHVKI